jgi:hypothetical protein
VNTQPGEGVEISGERGDQGFSLARLHFGDFPLMEDDTADQLDVEMPHAGRSARGFPHDRECFGQQIIRRGSLSELFLEFRGFSAQGGVGERLDPRFEAVDEADEGGEFFQIPFALRPEEFFRNPLDH